MPPLRAVTLLALALPLVVQSNARGDVPYASQTLVAVEVDPGSSGIDAATVRTAIGRELASVAVAPGDARAAQARGVLLVSIDPKEHELTVTYHEGTTSPVTRTIALPGGDAAIVRAAAFLAGNLARDEARDLVDALRGAKGVAGDGATSSSPPGADRGAPLPEVDPEQANLNRLHLVLAEHARHERVLRVAWWAVEGTSLALDTGALVAEITRHSYGAYLLGAGYLLFTGIGIVGYPTGFDDLLDHYSAARTQQSSPELVRRDVEHEWRRRARKERHGRTIAGWIDVGVGAALTGFDAWAAWDLRGTNNDLDPIWIGCALGGALMLGIGIDRLLSAGPLESAWDEYEATAPVRALPAPPAGVTGLRFGLIPLKGGGALSLGEPF